MKPLLCAILAVFTSYVALAAPPAAAAPPSSRTADQAEVVKGSNAFAVDLYAQLSKQPGNLFFSPESISTAFGMAYAGARGQTATEMKRVFHFTLPPDKLHPAMGALLAEMNAQHKGYELRVADALWAQQDASFEANYLKLVQSDYAAGFHRVNFKLSPESVRTTINAWVEKQTNDKIKDLISPGALNSTTRLVLTNAIYFKGNWQDPFDKEATQKEEFHLSASQWVMTSMMHRTGGYRYYDGGTFQAIELPYAGNEISMVVLLPKADRWPCGPREVVHFQVGKRLDSEAGARGKGDSHPAAIHHDAAVRAEQRVERNGHAASFFGRCGFFGHDGQA